MSASRDAIRSRIAPVVEAAGFDLDDLTVTSAGRRRLIRVVVDRDGGVPLDDAATVSRDISTMLDEDEVMGAGPYVLEVTSRGVDRPLTLPRHWRRNIGRLVQVKLPDGTEVTGRITAATESSASLDIDGADQPVEVSFTDVERALIQVEMRSMSASADDEHDLDDEADAPEHDD
jgi:ribosome maturation factor RimP